MKFKKTIFSLLLVMLFIPFFVNAKENDKVKVYVFEAGGCPYCEEQIKYLKGLDSYNKKFEIIQKELYVDHVDWAQGKDYELGKTVAEGFNAVGFEDASYQGTPFVVVSDIYASAAYNPNLESTILEAYEKGDADIVSCYADGKTDCLKHLEKKEEKASNGSSDSTLAIVLCTVVLIATYLVKSTYDNNKLIEALKKVNKVSKVNQVKVVDTHKNEKEEVVEEVKTKNTKKKKTNK